MPAAGKIVQARKPQGTTDSRLTIPSGLSVREVLAQLPITIYDMLSAHPMSTVKYVIRPTLFVNPVIHKSFLTLYQGSRYSGYLSHMEVLRHAPGCRSTIDDLDPGWSRSALAARMGNMLILSLSCAVSSRVSKSILLTRGR